MTLSTASAAQRAAAYLQKVPPAIDGHGGDLQTYRACCVLVNDFGLTESDAWPILLEWNRRCVPPWKERDLRVKFQSALRCQHPKPRGSKPGSLPGFPTRHSTASTPCSDCARPDERKPDRSGFGLGTRDQLQQLAKLRHIGLEGLVWAQERGVLVFGRWNGFECFGVTDSSGRILELRRLDGEHFPAHGELSKRKSHAVSGSRKTWPVGILEAAAFPCIAFVEGLPDFLAAHYLTQWEQSSHYGNRSVRCAPVAMLSSTPSMNLDALPHFKGKLVRIFPHADLSGAGLKGAGKWHRQILQAGAARCDIFDLTEVHDMTNGRVKDLNDFLRLADPSLFLKHAQLFKVLPDATNERN